jgi:hypothetical protein
MKIAFVLLLTVTLWVSSASAQEPPHHTVNMKTVMTENGKLDGKPLPDYRGNDDPLLDDKGQPIRTPNGGTMLKNPTCIGCPALTLGHAFYNAVMHDNSIPKDQIFAYAKLADRIADDPAAALTTKEVEVIEKELENQGSPIIVMQAFPLLNPNDKPAELK